MANTDNITVGAKGFAYFGEVGVTAPTDIATAWGTGWEDAGIILDDGLTEALNEDETTFGGWGYNSPIRIEPKSRTITFKLILTETTARALSLYYSVPIADMTTVGTGADIGVQFDDPETAQAIYVALGLDVIDEQTGRQFRYVVPRAKVSDRDNIEDKADSLHQYGLTMTAMVPTTGGTPVKRFVSKVPLPT
ncbi:phage tail tube protein [Actinomadura geliboluensis]|uniref:phage tail tube protein n=1 Tax=Actinomadura geliboluensis TaxID=882440 RepID=UPI0036751D9C